MNLRAPQTFVCVDISDSPQETLIQQERLDPCAPCSCLLHEFFNANFQRVGAEATQFFREGPRGKISQASETASIRVAQLAVVVQHETGMSMFFARLGCRIWCNLPGHSEMNEQCSRRCVTIRSRRAAANH